MERCYEPAVSTGLKGTTMKYIKFQDWIYQLPLWAEIDNYIYFALAGLFLWLSPIEGDQAVALYGALIGALVMKGRGPVKENNN